MNLLIYKSRERSLARSVLIQEKGFLLFRLVIKVIVVEVLLELKFKRLFFNFF